MFHRDEEEKVCISLCDFQFDDDCKRRLHSMLKGKLCSSSIELKPFSKQFNLLNTISLSPYASSSNTSFYQDVRIVYKYNLIIITQGSDLILLDYQSKQYLKSISIENGITSIEIDNAEEFLYLLVINYSTKCFSLQKHDLNQLVSSGGNNSLLWKNSYGFYFRDDEHISQRKIALKEVNSKQYVYLMYFTDGLVVYNGSNGELDHSFVDLYYNYFMKFNEKGQILTSSLNGLGKYTFCLEENKWKEEETEPLYASVEGIHYEKSSQLIYTIEDSYFIAWYDEQFNVENKKLDLQQITAMTIDERRGEIYIISSDRNLNIYN
ncbi:predicted protein [Naegleria gruberi]|uniref:Predicted protein n=1 Tax=Naegleria gruberi TaxID=5762 RepID=D2VQN0_NAEGR|nr:uncharacterized protein NAEGRDRAFT_51492 [Naegleria gruberi]EFC40899.1 predicted protein [Naegleria gruberi]|eukprot:XP_002673643.1 predicted protein [Naegleria gruberi strain NEG-M]